MKSKCLAAVALAAVALLVTAAPSDAAGAGRGSTDITRGLNYSEVFPDDICGPRASLVTFNFRMQMLHFTERDGTFNAQYTELLTYHVDFVDPALADQDSRVVDSIHHVFTPGQVKVFNETFHDFPNGLRIWYRAHETILNGDLIVQREVQRVTGCP